MEIKIYDYLQEDAIFIRTEVFIKEQKFRNEFDELDKVSTHLVIYDNEIPVGTCRFYKVDNDKYVLGRIAVVCNYRGLGIGKMILEEAENYIVEAGGKEINLSAQVRVQDFYIKMGYMSEGQPYLDEYCPHIAMKKLKLT